MTAGKLYQHYSLYQNYSKADDLRKNREGFQPKAIYDEFGGFLPFHSWLS
jgi:hypothetical protein